MKFAINDIVKYPKKERRNGVVVNVDNEKVMVKWPNDMICRYKEEVLEKEDNLEISLEEIEGPQPEEKIKENIDWDKYNGIKKKDKFVIIPLKDEEINWEKYHNDGRAK